MEQKPKRKNKQGLSRLQKIGIAIGALLSLICIGVLAVGIWAASAWSSPILYAEGEQALPLIEMRILNVQVPDSAQDIHVAYQAWADVFGYTAKVRFSLTPEETESWIVDTPLCSFGQATKDNSELYLGFPDANWWQPDEAQQLMSIECTANPAAKYQILIDQTNADRWIIYISATN